MNTFPILPLTYTQTRASTRKCAAADRKHNSGQHRAKRPVGSQRTTNSKHREIRQLNGGHCRTRTCDLVRVKHAL